MVKKNNGFTIKEALVYGRDMLTDVCENSLLDCYTLLEYTLSCDRIYITVHSNDKLTEEQTAKFFECLNRRKNNEPVSYITGKKEFMSLEFKVNKNVLIPRPETEMLAEFVTDYVNSINSALPVEILDMCTGSGAIAVSVKHYLKEKANVTALDISDKALDTAKENALYNNVRVEFLKADALKPLKLNKMFDIIVSNPPYIENNVIPTLEKDIKNFEPHIALDGGYDGLNFYRAICRNSDCCFKSGAVAVFEIGYNQGKTVSDILKEKFCNIKVHKDLFGNDRMVTAVKKGVLNA